MKYFSPASCWLVILGLIKMVQGGMIETTALMTCMDNSQLTASAFDVTFFSNNATALLNVAVLSTIDGNITAQIEVIAYGINVVMETLDGCNMGVPTLCPISSGHFQFETTVSVSQSVINSIPGIAYTIPDLDGQVKATLYYNNDLSTPIACVQATLTNGKTVQTKYASWAIAAICVVGLITAGITSLSGNVSTAAHIAANTVSLFVYFQSVAIISMMAVERLPPIAAAWAQNFEFTMGLMRITFMQNIFNWYVQSTGGTATNLLPNANLISLEVEKRDLTGIVPDLITYAPIPLRNGLVRNLYRSMSVGISTGATYLPNVILPRATSTSSLNSTTPTTTTNEKDPNLGGLTLILRGIQRVAYLTDIELSSVFLTGFTFFMVLGVLLVIIFALFKGIVEVLVKANKIAPGKFQEYRSGWLNVTKGVLFRLMLIGFPQLSVLCLWELVERDSPAVVVMAILAYLIVLATLGFAAYKVISLARRSLELYKNPAYILYSDPVSLNRWGFLYVQFRATAYYFIVPVLLYAFLKACFIAFGQGSGKAQAVGIFLIELAYLIGVSYLKPYMDKMTNAFNIAISAINLINAFMFMFFSQLFNTPQVVASIMGVVFFILNAVFSLVLLIMIIVSCVRALLAKNPDTRYQPMRDDRESFIPDAEIPEKKATTELDALGASARDGYVPEYESDENPFQSKTSLVNSNNDDIFPQARLPRNAHHPPQPVSNNAYDTNFSNNSYSSMGGSPTRSDSPAFQQQQTQYRGYYPTPNNSNYRPSRQQPGI